ncbi:PREDICTED: pre-mRNA-splicing factor CWC25 homolog [Nanorana parkeri]|uniref:pre-mRNA-splicing factor CWC25 homolog n=1 Tax=Nanorana parkeri TaxID=125878 RepID=UPI000854051F|nr:PREDICTED: pre-mRNA-splicing factor CWC25 homolog [Nanorana parkeri]
MGGGDLNLKKSWHPQTLRNVEKVWKAEQRHEAEQKKIEELQRELRDERAREEMQRFAEDTGAVKKKEEKLDWMYQGPGGMVNREEYLLGRPVDKFILDKMQEPESGPSTETGLLPGSIFSVSGATSALDMSNKIREDPLFMIRKREDEKKREVLSNPVKMKKIKELLQSSLDKKSKKKKKKHRKERSSSGSDEESGQERSRSHKHRPHSPARQKVPGYGLLLPQTSKSHKRDDASGSGTRRDRSKSPHRDRSHHKSKTESKYRRSPSPKREEKYQRQKPSGYTKKMSAEELEQRRLEMMQDAKQREVERENSVRKYKQEDEREEQKDRSRKEVKFLHKMKLESAASSSVEDRVKRNIHSIQRTASALERNFMKR